MSDFDLWCYLLTLIVAGMIVGVATATSEQRGNPINWAFIGLAAALIVNALRHLT